MIFKIYLGLNDFYVVYYNKLKKYEGENKLKRIRKVEDIMLVLSNSICDCIVFLK